MDPYAAALMIFAGVLHASWHAVVKSGKSQVTLVGMGLVSSVVLFPCIFFLKIPSVEQFFIIFISVFFHVGYKLFLSISYRLGDFIKIYALSRGLVPLCSVPISYFALGQIPNILQVGGILILTLGAATNIKITTVNKIERKLYFSAASASLFVAFYSVIDAYGSRIGNGWLTFTVWLVIIDSMCFAASINLIHPDIITTELMQEKKRIVLAGILGTGSFLVFLWALSRESAPSVIAFRECSVVFGTLISVFILKEAVSSKLLLNTLTISLGLFFIAYSK